MYYTFESNPFAKELADLFGEIFIFKKLNIDFEMYKKEILKQKPDFIIGIAKSTRDFSYFDNNCFNKFGKNKKLLKDGPEKYELFVPKNTDFKIIDNLMTRKSFCNWTMYKIKNSLEENGLKTELIFTHLMEKDLLKLDKLIRH